MTGLVDWASERARMVLAFIALTIIVGGAAYWSLPKEGEPDIEIPALFVSVPFPGISAEDSETLLVKVMETELADLDGLKKMSATASEGYAGLALEFEFGWDKPKILADVRDAMNTAEGKFPTGADKYTINEINFSEFPIIIVNLTGPVPERTMAQVAKQLQDDIEALDSVLEAGIAGNRDEMLEVLIDPLRLEAYNVTAAELIGVVQNNNQLIAAGEVETAQGTFSVKIPSSFDEPRDVYALPVKTNGDRVVTLGDLAEINLTFEDRQGTARFNGETTVALQVVKRKGFNLIDTATAVKEVVAKSRESWPVELQSAIEVGTSNDQSRVVDSMVKQLEGSVLTAIALVMIVVLAALGTRAALLVGFAIPTSFLLCFVLLAVMGVSVSNIVMFGLILAVGMLVDGAIVVVEYADKRISEGSGPMQAYTEAAKRMFWPIVSSTATTLCAFLPMLFWPGVPGEFMGMLPVTLIFVLSASLVVALIYLPVMGGVTGRMSRLFGGASDLLRGTAPFIIRLVLVPIAWMVMFTGALQMLNPEYLTGPTSISNGPLAIVPGFLIFLLGTFAASITMGSVDREIQSIISSLAAQIRKRTHWTVRCLLFVGFIVAMLVGLFLAFAPTALSVLRPLSPLHGVVPGMMVFLAALFLTVVTFKSFGDPKAESGASRWRARGAFGKFTHFIAGNPIMPIVTIAAVLFAVISVFGYFGANNNGVEFFVESEPEQGIVYVRARGNLSLSEKDEIVKQAETIVMEHPGIKTAFAFAGQGGLNTDTSGGTAPKDTIGQVQFETIPWEDRIDRPELDGDLVIEELTEDLKVIPGIQIEILAAARGPASGKPVHLRLKGDNWEDLLTAASAARTKFDQTPGLTLIEDTRPLPGIDWQIDVDVVKAGRYGADVATVGAMVQLVTRGILLDTMRVPSSDEEIEIRVRLPEQDRVLSTLDNLKVRTQDGLVPLSNFVTRQPVAKLAEISRVDQQRYFDVKADVESDLVTLTADTGSDDAPILATARLVDAEAEGMDRYQIIARTDAEGAADLQTLSDDGELKEVALNPNERIAVLTQWLTAEENPLPNGIDYEWTGDQEEQAESGAFLQNAFAGALGLMFIILLAQFNSFYNSILVLLAVILSTTGVLIGMLVMDQTFSIIMTGTGIVALAGIVVNNNIVLIDTYQEYSRYMPRIEAIVRTAQARIRPVLLTTITTMAGLAPMMYGLSLDFIGGGFTIDSPTALWWKQLATAVVFGLGIATVLTLVLTPALLALRVWVGTYALWGAQFIAKLSLGETSRAARDWALERSAAASTLPDIVWSETYPVIEVPEEAPLKAAE